MTLKEIKTETEQLKESQLRERIRAKMPKLIKLATDIAINGDSDSARLGAIKLLTSKVLSDTIEEISDTKELERQQIVERIKQQRAKHGL